MYGLCCCFWLRPFDLLNVLLCGGHGGRRRAGVLGKTDLFFSAGAMTLMAAHVLAGPQLAPDNLTSGAILLTGILVLYVGLKVQRHLSRWHFAAFVAGYFLLYFVFVVLLQNAEPLFILYLLGLAATARSLRLTAYFWAIVLSFSFCQPYAWESLAAFSFLLTALLGARGNARSATTLLFLGGGLVLVLSLLFPILTVILREDMPTAWRCCCATRASGPPSARRWRRPPCRR